MKPEVTERILMTEGQQYPPGTQEKYNSFHSRIPVMEDGMKPEVTERQGGVWKSEGFPMKGSGILSNPSDFESRILMTGGSPYRGFPLS